MNDVPWWQAAFADHYETVYAHRDDDSAKAEIDGILPLLQNIRGPVLDLGCGNGRHFAAMHEAGIHVFGLDWSMPLLRRAYQRPLCRGRLVRADMRMPPVDSGWAGIVMLFTAFGYFSDDENAACFARIASLLQPGGLWLLDQPDPAVVKATLVPRSSRTLAHGGSIDEERSLQDERVIKTVTIRDAAGDMHSYKESVALYTIDYYRSLAAAHGLSLTKRWHSLHGELQNDGRLIMWFERKP